MKTSIYGAIFAATLVWGGVAQATELKISHVRPQDTTIDKEVKVFADAVAKATGGDVTIRLPVEDLDFVSCERGIHDDGFVGSKRGGQRLLATTSDELPAVITREPTNLSVAHCPRVVVEIGKLRHELGFRPAAPLEQRLSDTVAWYRNHGWL